MEPSGPGTSTRARSAGVPKPRLLTNPDWSDGDWRFRAEFMTVAPSPVIANGMMLRGTPDLTPTWWADLRRAVDTRATHSTERVCVASSGLRLRLLAAFDVDIDPAKLEWTCAHGDLHWANLTAPHLTLLDWEAWGMAPAGYDAAVLYCASILHIAPASSIETFFMTCGKPSPTCLSARAGG